MEYSRICSVLNYTVILNSLGSEWDEPSDGEYICLLVTDKGRFCLRCFLSRLGEKLFEKIILDQHNFIRRN